MRIAFLLGLLFGRLDGQEAAPPVLTVCEVMQDLDRLDGQPIVVIGPEVSTIEGAWLEQECSGHPVTEGYSWPNLISLRYGIKDFAPAPRLPDGFHWDKALLRSKLGQVKRTEGQRWVAVYGRLESRRRQVLHRPWGSQSHGYGHYGEAPAQLFVSQNGRRRLR